MGPLSAFFVFTEYARRSLMLRVVDAKRAWRCVVLKARVRSSGSFIYSISPDPSRRRVRLRQRVDGSDGICDLFTATAYLNEPLRVRPCGSIFFFCCTLPDSVSCDGGKKTPGRLQQIFFHIFLRTS